MCVSRLDTLPVADDALDAAGECGGVGSDPPPPPPPSAAAAAAAALAAFLSVAAESLEREARARVPPAELARFRGVLLLPRDTALELLGRARSAFLPPRAPDEAARERSGLA